MQESNKDNVDMINEESNKILQLIAHHIRQPENPCKPADLADACMRLLMEMIKNVHVNNGINFPDHDWRTATIMSYKADTDPYIGGHIVQGELKISIQKVALNEPSQEDQKVLEKAKEIEGEPVNEA